MRLLPLLRAAVDWIEESPITPARWAGLLAAVIAVRHLLETATSQYPLYSSVQFFVHYPLAYLAPLLALTLLLSFLSGERVERVARLMLFAWLLTLLPPLVDLAAGRRHGAQIGYLFSSEHRFFPPLLSFMNPAVDLPGTTRGIRIEAAVACLLGALYVRIKGRNWLRTVLSVPLVLLVCLFFFTLPVRFHQACRLFFPDLTIGALYTRAGRLAIEEPVAVTDMVIVAYLAPLVLALFLVFLVRLEGREGAGLVARLGSTRALLPGVSAVLAAFAARMISGPATLAAPAEALALLGIGLSALLAGGTFPGPQERDQVLRHEPYLSFSTSALALGVSAAIGPAPLALVATVLSISAFERLPPLRVASWPALGEAATGFSALAAALAGAALFFGRETIVRMPPSLAMSLFAAAVLLRVASREGEGSVRLSRALAAGLCPLAFPLLLGEMRLLLPLALLGAAAAIVVSGGSRRPVGAIAPAVTTAVLLGGGLLAVGAPDVTKRLFEESVRSPYFHLRQGEAAHKRGDRAAAEQAFRTALQKDPGFTPALIELGQLFVETKDFRSAIEQYETAVRLDGHNASAHNNLGAALMATGKVQEALPQLEEAVRLEPSNCGALYNKAAALDRLDRLQEAGRAWREYLLVSEKGFDDSENIRRARERYNQLTGRDG